MGLAVVHGDVVESDGGRDARYARPQQGVCPPVHTCSPPVTGDVVCRRVKRLTAVPRPKSVHGFLTVWRDERVCEGRHVGDDAEHGAMSRVFLGPVDATCNGPVASRVRASRRRKESHCSLSHRFIKCPGVLLGDAMESRPGLVGQREALGQDQRL